MAHDRFELTSCSPCRRFTGLGLSADPVAGSNARTDARDPSGKVAPVAATTNQSRWTSGFAATVPARVPRGSGSFCGGAPTVDAELSHVQRYLRHQAPDGSPVAARGSRPRSADSQPTWRNTPSEEISLETRSGSPKAVSSSKGAGRSSTPSTPRATRVARPGLGVLARRHRHGAHHDGAGRTLGHRAGSPISRSADPLAVPVVGGRVGPASQDLSTTVVPGLSVPVGRPPWWR